MCAIRQDQPLVVTIEEIVKGFVDFVSSVLLLLTAVVLVCFILHMSSSVSFNL